MFDVLDEWVKDYPRDELLERAQLLRQPYATVRPPEALFDDEQLIERGYFAEVEHPELGPQIPLPGRAVSFQRHAVARHAASAAGGRAYRRDFARRARDGS